MLKLNFEWHALKHSTWTPNLSIGVRQDTLGSSNRLSGCLSKIVALNWIVFSTGWLRVAEICSGFFCLRFAPSTDKRRVCLANLRFYRVAFGDKSRSSTCHIKASEQTEMQMDFVSLHYTCTKPLGCDFTCHWWRDPWPLNQL